MNKLESKDDSSCSEIFKTIYPETMKSLRSYGAVRSSSTPRSSSPNRRRDLLRFRSLHLLKLDEHSGMKSDGRILYLFKQERKNVSTKISSKCLESLESMATYGSFCILKIVLKFDDSSEVHQFRQLVSFKWSILSTLESDGMKSYLFREQGMLVWTEMVWYFESMLIFRSLRFQARQFPRHTLAFDLMRMSAFFYASLPGYMTEKLPRVHVEEMWMTIDFCLLYHTKTAIWAGWMRINAFFFDSSAELLNEELPSLPILPRGNALQTMSLTVSSRFLYHVKTGIWVIALELVGCSLTKLHTYEGKIQTLDARKAELFLSEICKNGSWDYKLIDLMHPKDRTTSDIIQIWALVAPPAGVPEYLPAESEPSCPKPQVRRRQRDDDEDNRIRKKTKGADYLPHPCYRCKGCDSDIVPIQWVEEVDHFQNHDARTLLRWISPSGNTIEAGNDSNIVARGTESFVVFDLKCHKCKLLLGFQQVSFALLAGYLTARKRIGLCYFYRAQLY